MEVANFCAAMDTLIDQDAVSRVASSAGLICENNGRNTNCGQEAKQWSTCRICQ